MFPAPSKANSYGLDIANPPVPITLPVLGANAATGESLNPYKGTLRMGTGGLLLSRTTTAPLLSPAAVGRNWTFTTQEALVVPFVHVVPATAVKSRLAVPCVSTCTL